VTIDTHQSDVIGLSLPISLQVFWDKTGSPQTT